MRARVLAAGLLLSCAIAVPARASTTKTFPAGSLIIPTTASFQDDCGAVSAYGLIYDILRAESWLVAHGKAPITVNYTISDSKASPNRCRPTTNSAISPANASSLWTDGCDFSVTGTGTLVKMISNSSTLTTTDTAFSTLTTSSSTVWPHYATHAIAGETTVSYMGGPFVIDATATDVTNFLALLAGSANGGFDATDSTGATIDFSPFRATGTCSFGTTHHVNIHRAQVSFTAPVRKAFTSQPPRLAVLETDNTGTPANKTGQLFANILENYLKNGGLAFTGAQGCPTGGFNLTAAPGLCPNGGNAGQIFDVFDFQDLVNNKLTIQDAGVNRYTMLWTPHWELKSGGGPSGTEINAMANVQTFLNSATGLMGECASISTYEGATAGGANDTLESNQLQTCKGSTSCTGTQSFPIERAPSGLTNNTNLHNCSDPTSPGGSACAKFPVPADEFVQIGDYIWNTDQGHVIGFSLNSNTIFQPGVIPLIAAYDSSGSTFHGYISTRNLKDNTPGKANILYLGGHDQTGTVAGTKMALETLLLLGVTSLPPVETMTETSRATPISATLPGINKAVIFTGTTENVQPPISPPTVNSGTDLTHWQFPFVKGHLRATDDTSIQAGGVPGISLGSGSVEFDAATQIPTVSVTGCGTDFHGTCRSVFTTTATPDPLLGVALHPPIVMVKEGNAGTIGPLMVGTSSLVAADFPTLMDRVLQGYWNGTTYVATLGGIDRSTVAVIGPSAITNQGARATMAYVGASDGMIHAICAETNAAKGCPTLGTELWAFLPRSQLPAVRLNKAKIDGSPHVIDAFGTFEATATKSFRTILTFQTGSGDPTDGNAAQPAIYALDVTDPQNPTVVWEKTIGTPGAGRGADQLGVGLTVETGPINILGIPKSIAIAETNNGGTNGAVDATAGVIVNGLDLETGLSLWASPFIHAYGATRSGGALVPHTGIPGGAVGVDKLGQGYFTDVVFGDLYGEVWQLDVVTGLSRYLPTKPLFSFTTDFRPIGTTPALYSNGSQQFAIIASGGYADLADTPSWGTGHQQEVVAIALSPTIADVTLHETTASLTDIPFHFNLNGTELAFAQATVVGGQVFVTSDTGDVNASGFGTTGIASGNVYTSGFTSNAATVVGIQGGAGSVTNAGTTIFAAGSSKQQVLATGATTTVGAKVDSYAQQKLSRMLWLRTE